MNRLAAILPAANVLVDVDATSKKRVFEHAGMVGFLLIALASLDYWRNTQPPSKFFPVDGESTRSLER